MSPSILLTTLNAKYHHASFGLRYLYANLGELKNDAKILEFTIKQAHRDIVEAILIHQPKIVGFGVYIWNTEQTYEVVSILKRINPEIIIVLGGPEVSYETETQPICDIADYTIRGEADFLFYEFCLQILKSNQRPSKKWISGELPDIKKIQLPYLEYSDEDIRDRVIYVEASRGCPYKCEYCLSSLDKSVRNFDLDLFLQEMDRLISRGVKQFKFVDRTFNLSISTSSRILQFFLDRISKGLFLHFEMVPDRLPNELRDLIRKFPQGSLQFEIGIQTWNPQVARLVSRRQDYTKIAENFLFLTQETGVHTHADLIVGLPGETAESFGQGFDALYALGPDEIQVGILKRLKGTPIIRHDQEWGMVYQEAPPFQILRTKMMSFGELQNLNRFAQFWNLYSNSGNFKTTMKTFVQKAEFGSVFSSFMKFVQFLTERHPQGNGIALLNLVESAWIYFTQNLRWDPSEVRSLLIQDYTGQIKRDIPHFLRTDENRASCQLSLTKRLEKGFISLPKRQKKHQLLSAIEVVDGQ